MARRWIKEEIEIMHVYFPYTKNEDMARHLNRTKKAIESKAFELGIGKIEDLDTRFKKGSIPWNKGKPWSEEVKLKLRANHADMSGEKNPFFKRHHSREVRERLRELNLGRHLTDETKKNIRRALLGNPNIKGFLKGHIPWNKGTYGLMKPNSGSFKKGQHPSPETEFNSERASDPEFRRRCLKGMLKKPTRPEKRLTKIIVKHDLPFKYVGDGEFMLGRKCPDFLNSNGKKQLIELWGNYWHKNDDPEKRINFFRQYGFETLIIWEDELRNEPQLVEKIQSFSGQKVTFIGVGA